MTTRGSPTSGLSGSGGQGGAPALATTSVIASAVAQHFEKQQLAAERAELAEDRRVLEEERLRVAEERAALDRERIKSAAAGPKRPLAASAIISPRLPPAAVAPAPSAAAAAAAASASPSFSLSKTAPTTAVPPLSLSADAKPAPPSPLTPKRFWQSKKKASDIVIVSVEHRVHVDHDYNWTNVNPDEAFVKIAKVGEGSYGVVWQVKHRDVGTVFAAKVIPVLQEPENLAKEIKVLKACRSPHIVSYYGTITHGKSIWVLMDFCSLGSLREAMELCGRSLTEREISAAMAGALEGLNYLHGLGIMHLDVKAANILMTGDLQVKLADFGVSEQVHILGSNSGMQSLIGTVRSIFLPTFFLVTDRRHSFAQPFWIAPEIVLKRPHSSKADVWSLGITAIELAERNPPGFKLNPFRYMQMVPNRSPPELSEPAKWSGEFTEFISKCLCIDPAKRLSCSELLQTPFAARARGQNPQPFLQQLAEGITAAKEKKMSSSSMSPGVAAPKILRPHPSPPDQSEPSTSSKGADAGSAERKEIVIPGIPYVASPSPTKGRDAVGSSPEPEPESDQSEPSADGLGTVVVKGDDGVNARPQDGASPDSPEAYPADERPPGPGHLPHGPRPRSFMPPFAQHATRRRSRSVDTGVYEALKDRYEQSAAATASPTELTGSQKNTRQPSVLSPKAAVILGRSSELTPPGSPSLPKRSRLFNLFGRSKQKEAPPATPASAIAAPTPVRISEQSKKKARSGVSPLGRRRKDTPPVSPSSPLSAALPIRQPTPVNLDDSRQAPARAPSPLHGQQRPVTPHATPLTVDALLPLKSLLENLQKEVSSLRSQMSELEERTRPEKIKTDFKAVIGRELSTFKGVVLERVDEKVALQVRTRSHSSPAPKPQLPAAQEESLSPSPSLSPKREGIVQQALAKFGHKQSPPGSPAPVAPRATTPPPPAGPPPAAATVMKKPVLQRQEAIVARPTIQQAVRVAPVASAAVVSSPSSLPPLPHAASATPIDPSLALVRQQLQGARRMYLAVVPSAHELLRLELLSEIGELAAKLKAATTECGQAASDASAQLRKEAAANAAALRADALAAVAKHATELQSRIVEGLADRVGEALRKREAERSALLRRVVREAVKEEVRDVFKKMLS